MAHSTNATKSEQESKFLTSVFAGVARGFVDVFVNNINFHTVSYIRQHAQPGDVLEFKRKLFSHYALYLGHGKVMNINAEDWKTTEAFICEMTLEEVCKSCKVRVRNHDDIATEHFQTSANTVFEIIQAAKSFQNTMVPYEFDFRNCEYYSTLWRYGKGFSTQVAKPTVTPAGTMLGGVMTSFETSKSALTAVEKFREIGQYAKYKTLAAAK